MQEEVIQKLVIRWGFFKNQLLVAKDLWWSKNTRNSVQVNKATDVHQITIIAQPGVLKSQKCVKMWTRSRPRKVQNSAEVFHCISHLCENARYFLEVNSL